MALRQLAYVGSSDQFNEYLRIADSTERKCLKLFCRAVVAAFGNEYLRRPHSHDVQRLVQMHKAKHSFPEIFGSIECMYWAWKNCLTMWKAAYANFKKGAPTVILEAVASTDLWIWHAFYSVAGSNNDINVLNQSDVFSDYLKGVALVVGEQQVVQHEILICRWYLFEVANFREDSAMSDRSTESTIRHEIRSGKEGHQERAFSVLQARWMIVRGLARMHYVENLTEIMYARVIMHNMIIEDEEEDVKNWEDNEASSSSANLLQARQGVDVSFACYMQRQMSLRNVTTNEKLEEDMTEKIWACFGHH